MKLDIIEINELEGTMIIDWGTGVLNHWIPSQLLDGAERTSAEILAILEDERPLQVNVTAPLTLKGMVYVPPVDLAAEAKRTRDDVIATDIEFAGVAYQNDSALRDTLDDANILGMPDSTSQAWRLANDKWRTTTLAELKQILALAAMRKQDVWNQFNAWDSGDKLQPFSVVL